MSTRRTRGPPPPPPPPARLSSMPLDATVQVVWAMGAACLLLATLVSAGCRDQERVDCESVCVYNGTSGQHVCTIRAAVILPNDTTLEASLPRVMPVLHLAEQRVRELQLLPSTVHFKWLQYDDRCDASYATISAMDGYGISCAHVLFGPSCDYALAPVSRIVKYFRNDGTPLLTSGGYTFDFVKRKTTCTDEYHLLVRTGLLSFQAVSEFMVDVMHEHKWSKSVLFYERSGHYSVGGLHTCHLLMQSLVENYRKHSFSYESFATDSAVGNLTEHLRRVVGLEHSIVILCANSSTIREIMLAADELNMVDSGEYVFINLELHSSQAATSVRPWYNPRDTNETNDRARHAYSAMLTLIAEQPEDKEYVAFSQQVREMAALKYNYTFDATVPVSSFATAFYDAVLLYAYALNQTITEYPNTLYHPLNGTRITQMMWNRQFRGITGNVSIDANGDRVSKYLLLDMNEETGYFEVVAQYHNETGMQFVPGKRIHWAGGREDAPPDMPKCGFDGSLCPSLPGYAILSLILSFAIILMTIASFIGYRHYKLEAEINSMTWKVNWNDLVPCYQGTRTRTGGSMHSLVKRGSQLTVYSEDMVSIPGDKQLYIPMGFYKGCKIAIKKIHETDISLNRAQMLELKKMKDLQHEHLVRFVGACIDPPDCCILTEYCPKGSLQDILENEQIKLDWMFKLSLMHDIVRGMHFLHSTDIRSHGNLKSSNCVVDSRFVLKITDFGLHKLRRVGHDDDRRNADSHAFWKRLLWTAPELLRMHNPPPEGTQKGDSYSFGIIVHEIATRQGPFYVGFEDRSPKEIIQLVRDGPADPTASPFRPKSEDTAFDDINMNMQRNCVDDPTRPQIEDTAFRDIRLIMQRCWSEDPFDRPDFGMLKSTIRKINKENETGNIVDNLLQRMEQYANNLEGLVEERTEDYLEEKKKCEELLYQLLPRSVAAQLILGKPVIAEVFEQVTIYFSDIVGFTAISAASTPMQVVDLLNDLYTCFDSIVGHFDVYKVETIGDAYMVVSGLPVRNGNLHAREIARTALALLETVYKFRIRHRPNEQLRLRIGLHSGSCVAGVVGLKMPRYCLFGDTVNTASRMESNGEALRIHISQSTKQLLDTFGTFIIRERGEVEMKGKGKMLTYWLEGEHERLEPEPPGEYSVEDLTVPILKSTSNGHAGGDKSAPGVLVAKNNPVLFSFDTLVKSNNLKNSQYAAALHVSDNGGGMAAVGAVGLNGDESHGSALGDSRVTQPLLAPSVQSVQS